MNDFVDLRRVIGSVFRWWWLLILATTVAALIGYWVSDRQPRVYGAATTVMVGQWLGATQLDTKDIQTGTQLALTYADIGRRQPVLQGVVDNLNLNDTWQQLRSRVQIAPVEDTQLLEIGVEAGSPEEAEAIADQVAHQLILLSPTPMEDQEQDENRRLIHQRLEDLQAKIEAGQARRDALEMLMLHSSSASQMQELRASIDALESLIASWENSHTQLLIFVEGEKSPNYLTVIEPAHAYLDPVRPRVRLNALVAGVIGFCLALGAIFLFEYLDDTLKSADDLSRSLGLPPLGTVGRIQGKTYQDQLVVSQDPFSPVSEAYRKIRGNIQFVSVDQPAKTIVVTSSSAAEGKSITAANLGLVMAQAGLKTIIVDADMRQPVQHRIFNEPNLGGLTDLLCAAELEIGRHLRNTNVQNLQLITCGITPPNPSELLGSQRMAQLLASLEEVADVVILDSSPVVSVADAAVLASQVGGVVLVTYAGRTRRDVARQAVLSLQQAGANLLGGILNGDRRKDKGFYYHQYYASDRRGLAGQLGNVRQRRWWQRLSFIR